MRFFAAALAAVSSVVATTIVETASMGPLRILENIGRGRNALVYKAVLAAEDKQGGPSFFAVKVIAGKDAEILALEVEVLTALRTTQGFPRIHGAEKGLIVMEMLEGKSLDKFSSVSDLPIPLNQMAIQLIDRLQAVHSAGFVHVDMHKRNIMVQEDRVCLLDFGLAVRIREPKNPLYVNLFLSSENEQARNPLYPIDDIERLMYVLMDFQVELPWTSLMRMREQMDQETRSRDVQAVVTSLEARILAMKVEFHTNNAFFERHARDLPPAYRQILKYIAEHRPVRENPDFTIDYSYLKSLLAFAV